MSGGVGSRKVTIKLASKWFKGYAFTVIITGYYENGGNGGTICVLRVCEIDSND